VRQYIATNRTTRCTQIATRVAARVAELIGHSSSSVRSPATVSVPARAT
jgi:hypothetical protein